MASNFDIYSSVLRPKLPAKTGSSPRFSMAAPKNSTSTRIISWQGEAMGLAGGLNATGALMLPDLLDPDPIDAPNHLED